MRPVDLMRPSALTSATTAAGSAKACSLTSEKRNFSTAARNHVTCLTTASRPDNRSGCPMPGAYGSFTRTPSAQRPESVSPSYSEHDLSNLLVRLHVSIGFDDGVERKGLGDFRFEFSGVEAFVDVALGPRESLRSGPGGLRQPVATNSQRLLESWYERKWRFSHGQPAIFDDYRLESGCLRELAEQRTCDRIENDARTRPISDVFDARHQVFFVRHDHMIRAECKQFASFGSCAGRCDGNGSLGFHSLNCGDTNAAGSRRDESELSLLQSAKLD